MLVIKCFPNVFNCLQLLQILCYNKMVLYTYVCITPVHIGHARAGGNDKACMYLISIIMVF